MKIRILEDGPTMKKGIIDVSPEVALKLISEGTAVRVKEDSTDKGAKDALLQAKSRDKEQGSNT